MCIRDRYNTLIQAAILSEKEKLTPTDLELALAELPESRLSQDRIPELPIGDGFDLEEHLNSIRYRYLQRAMEEAHGVKSEAARLLGMDHYQTLSNQLERLNVTGDWN